MSLFSRKGQTPPPLYTSSKIENPITSNETVETPSGAEMYPAQYVLENLPLVIMENSKVYDNMPNGIEKIRAELSRLIGSRENVAVKYVVAEETDISIEGDVIVLAVNSEDFCAEDFGRDFEDFKKNRVDYQATTTAEAVGAATVLDDPVFELTETQNSQTTLNGLVSSRLFDALTEDESERDIASLGAETEEKSLSEKITDYIQAFLKENAKDPEAEKEFNLNIVVIEAGDLSFLMNQKEDQVTATMEVPAHFLQASGLMPEAPALGELSTNEIDQLLAP